MVSGSEDSRVYVWHRTSGALLRVLSGHASTVSAVAWSPSDPTLPVRVVRFPPVATIVTVFCKPRAASSGTLLERYILPERNDAPRHSARALSGWVGSVWFHYDCEGNIFVLLQNARPSI